MPVVTLTIIVLVGAGLIFHGQNVVNYRDSEMLNAFAAAHAPGSCDQLQGMCAYHQSYLLSSLNGPVPEVQLSSTYAFNQFLGLSLKGGTAARSTLRGMDASLLRLLKRSSSTTTKGRVRLAGRRTAFA